MWLFTRFGFFSVTCAHTSDPKKHAYPVTDPGLLMVRARKEDHLIRLKSAFPELAGFEVKTTTHNDYHFRIIVPKETFASVAAKLIADIAYGNFKSECHREFDGTAEGRQYVNVLHSVWGRHKDMQYAPRPKSPNLFDYDAGAFNAAHGELVHRAAADLGFRELKGNCVVLAVREGMTKPAPLVGVIAWPRDFADMNEAYLVATSEGVIPAVKKPVCEKVRWSDVREAVAGGVPVFNLSTPPVTPIEDLEPDYSVEGDEPTDDETAGTTHGRCDQCGGACDADGCTIDRGHSVANG